MNVHIMFSVIILLLGFSSCSKSSPAKIEIEEVYRYSTGAHVVYNYAIEGAQLKSLVTPDLMSCGLQCLRLRKCVSYNYQISVPKDGVCELNTKETKLPGYRPGFVFVQANTKMHETKSCLDHRQNGAIRSGVYRLHDNLGNSYPAFCDMTSEPGAVWTLVMSQSFKNRAMPEFQLKGLPLDVPVNQNTPNWEAYRLSLKRMEGLRSRSTHWRVTCSFPSHGVDYRDYVRVKFVSLDPLEFTGRQVCKTVELINVMGHHCTACSAAWWQLIAPQNGQMMLHHDSSFTACQLGATPRSVPSQDNFGFYSSTNTKFRCTSNADSNTNHWFGGFI